MNNKILVLSLLSAIFFISCGNNKGEKLVPILNEQQSNIQVENLGATYTEGLVDIVFTPQWLPQSQFAGFYAALYNGYYKDVGINLKIKHTSVSNSALNNLLDGECDIITMQLADAMINIDKGVDLVNVLQIAQHTGLMVVSKKDSLTTLEDLKGKKVGIWKKGFGEMAQIADIEKQLSIEWIPFLNNTNLLISDAIDASLAMSYGEYQQLLISGIDNLSFIRFSELGYDVPEDGVYVQSHFIKENPEIIKAFVEATKKGWQWVYENIEEALAIVMTETKNFNVKTNYIIQKGMLEEIIQLQKDTPESEPSFELYEEDVKWLSNKLLTNGFIENEVSLSKMKGVSNGDKR